jgi:5-methylcytosine-specific restriction endonuclease McrA
VSQYTPRTRKYWLAREQVKREEPSCWQCHRWIDPKLKWPHPFSFTADHLISPKDRPDLAEVRSNLRAAHFRCNRLRYKQSRNPGPAGYSGYETDMDDL